MEQQLEQLKTYLQSRDEGRSVHIKCFSKQVYESFLKGLFTNSKEWLSKRKVLATQAEDKKYYIEIELLDNKEAVTIARKFINNLQLQIEAKMLEIVYRDLNAQ